jgi:2'-5' RNA ligase
MNLSRTKPWGDTVRTFVALALSEQAKRDVEDLQKRLLAAVAGAGVSLRPTPVHQFHVTLAFLGEISKERIPSVIAAISDLIGCSHAPLQLATEGFLIFPSARRARVIAVAFVDPSGELIRVASALHDRLSSVGFALEQREFKPHVTLARLKQPAQFDWWSAYHPIPIQHCSTIAVYQSRLGAGGSRYQVLHQASI